MKIMGQKVRKGNYDCKIKSFGNAEKNKGEVLSGESIAGELGCTRAAVWKAVKSLREEGYHINRIRDKGYMLAKDTNRLSQEGIRLFLDDPKVKIDIYDELESTNQTAKKEAMMGEGRTWGICHCQEPDCRQGRRGREFYSPADTGLYMSVILKPQGTIHDSLLITTGSSGSLQSSSDLWESSRY